MGRLWLGLENLGLLLGPPLEPGGCPPGVQGGRVPVPGVAGLVGGLGGLELGLEGLKVLKTANPAVVGAELAVVGTLVVVRGLPAAVPTAVGSPGGLEGLEPRLGSPG